MMDYRSDRFSPSDRQDMTRYSVNTEKSILTFTWRPPSIPISLLPSTIPPLFLLFVLSPSLHVCLFRSPSATSLFSPFLFIFSIFSPRHSYFHSLHHVFIFFPLLFYFAWHWWHIKNILCGRQSFSYSAALEIFKPNCKISLSRCDDGLMAVL